MRDGVVVVWEVGLVVGARAMSVVVVLVLVLVLAGSACGDAGGGMMARWDGILGSGDGHRDSNLSSMGRRGNL
jgi:hypothetical protein